MARSYSRDSSGKFSGAGKKGDLVSTVQQNKAEKSRMRNKAKADLSGGKLGTKRGRKVSRNKAAGKGASLKSVRGALDRARARFA